MDFLKNILQVDLEQDLEDLEKDCFDRYALQYEDNDYKIFTFFVALNTQILKGQIPPNTIMRLSM